MAKGFKHVDDTETRLLWNMNKEGIPWRTTQRISGRSSDTLTRIFAKMPVMKTAMKGAPKKMTNAAMTKVLKAKDALLKQANAQTEVTASMIKEHAGVHVCDRTLQLAFMEHHIKCLKLKEKPLLTVDDTVERFAWARQHHSRSQAAWIEKPHAIIDNKHFQLFTTSAGREYAARRSVRGAYQTVGQVPLPHLVKPKGGPNKFSAPGVTVTAAVIKGRIRMWNYVEGSWNGEAAVTLYKGPLLKAMEKAYPEHAQRPYAKWIILEDNDPAGYKSSKGMAAKAVAGIVTDHLPRRSPDLNVLDYSLWHAINEKMRQTEKSWPKTKKESVFEFTSQDRNGFAQLLGPQVRRPYASPLREDHREKRGPLQGVSKAAVAPGCRCNRRAPCLAA